VAWSSACVGAGLVPARATIRRSVTRVAAPRVTVRVSPEPGVGRQIPVDELPADPLNSLKMEGDLPISAELLEILACPSCKAEVVLTADRTGLECTSCHLVYPIRDGIPVMLIDEAIKPPDEGGESSA
jgi:uncharacterized protein YbaR (Trm112 family)